MTLPIFQGGSKEFSLLQTNWAQQLNPLITNPMLQGNLLKGLALLTGANVINHRLSRKLQGWWVVDQDGVANFYRSAAKNDVTLTLTASANVNIDLYVF